MKKLVCVAAAVAMACTARAELLYFMANAFTWTGPQYFDYAVVGVAKDGNVNWGKDAAPVYLEIRSSLDAGTGGGSPYLAADAARYHAEGWADLTDYTTDEYTFYVAAYENYAADPVFGYSAETAQSYAQLKAAGHVYDPGSTDPQSVTPWTVPEPTGGLLWLFGAALLALRRKRV